MPRKSFSVHSDYYDELCALSAEQRGDLMLALIGWAADMDAPKLDPVTAVLFRLMKAQTERISSVNSANGVKGGRPKTTEKSEDKRKKPTVTVTDTVTNSVTVTDTEADTITGDTPLAPLGDDLASFNFSDEVRGALDDWLRYKKERRESYKPTGLKTLLAQVEGKQGELTGKEIVRAISESMASNYRGIVWDKAKERSGPPGRSAKSSHGHNPEDYDTPYERSMATLIFGGDD